MDSLNNAAQQLLGNALAANSQVSYRRSVSKFENFRSEFKLGAIWPASIQHVVHYVSFLSLKGLAASTIATQLSAISYVHKINMWVDPTDNFIIRKLKEGCRRKDGRGDSRLPISLPILQQLVLALPHICQSSFESSLFRAAFCLAFFGFLRVGEFTAVSRGEGCDRCLAFSDVKVAQDQTYIELVIRFSKTDQIGSSSCVNVGVNPIAAICPVKGLIEYLKLRPAGEGPLFLHFGGDPLTRFQFDSMLKKGIRATGLSPEGFSSHSFRIGAATSAAVSGVPLDTIMAMGRWRSSAVRSYIRPHRIPPAGAWVAKGQ